MATDILSGKWMYRSFYNDRHEMVRAAATTDEQAKRALALLWAEGVALFETPASDGKVIGKLVFRPAAAATETAPASPEIGLALSGQLQLDAAGSPEMIELQGVGPTVDPRQPWKYLIKGWFVEPWEVSPSQSPSFVGSVVPHGAHRSATASGELSWALWAHSCWSAPSEVLRLTAEVSTGFKE